MMNKLPDLITEYGQSLTRMEAEREVQKDIIAKAAKLSIYPATFKKVATAYYKDKVGWLKLDNQAQLDLVEALEQ